MTVSRESVSADDTDFSAIVANVGNDVDVVVFATQVRVAANTLSNQLREQGKNAIVFGMDGAYSPSLFKPRRGYVSLFTGSPSCHVRVGSIREYNRYSKNKAFGAFGPPTYMAGLVAMTAIEDACDAGTTDRTVIVREVRRTDIPSIFGGRIRFSRIGDPLPTRFVIYGLTARSTPRSARCDRGVAGGGPRKGWAASPTTRPSEASVCEITRAWTGTSSSSSS